MKTKLHQWKFHSVVGPIYLVVSEKGLRGAFWKKQDIPYANDLSEHPLLKKTIEELSEYLEGKRKTFSIELDLQGSAFQKSVWSALLKIPYGETCTYSDIARKIKNVKAVRAVGAANGKNPISIIIPCHRVIGSNGKLTGYAGGLKVKEKLLTLEKELL
ncbi:methylated-DNA--[protein]-cysteine S-methyltransferase [Bacteriovorax stolpii]|uniref:Methylated-DNA--protein-cysteine methyltransferase n=1 Tax=Bacteriovorax stolpii TaxID=960 RepID=A0A2K9NXG6_BACTC|nr:methylated-DNA--[protein]-cysteine S-methyltransferase [Bacteriovorax stolpii]AUO00214.1 methylated-DNA--[protein]-cysteine S-methyltransferase [Bacteriovorax stolpii]QDK43585.1 methylated-DNA--[protein]-cysteine S-methyltransferase [Bacteriovorax stolpii]TDP55559.1 methylated-DNA-[protein]-cysteine S-methyltransferase [Bacteriovorax stolpii]